MFKIASSIGWLTWVTVWSACLPGSRGCVVPPYDLLLCHRPSLLLAEGVAASKEVKLSLFCGENATDLWFDIQHTLRPSPGLLAAPVSVYFFWIFSWHCQADEMIQTKAVPYLRQDTLRSLSSSPEFRQRNVQKCFLLIKCVANTVYSPFPHAKNQCIALQLKLG